MGYGFRNTDNLVALLMLRCGDCQPQLPGRPGEGEEEGREGSEALLPRLAPCHTNYRSLSF